MSGPDDSITTTGEAIAGPPGRRRLAPLLIIVVVLVLAGTGLGVWLATGGTPAAAIGPEGVALQDAPDLAPAATTAGGAPVDGITCRGSADDKVVYHIHLHVSIFVNGHQKRIPAGAGIADRFAEHLANGLFVDNSDTGCLYWLHLHSNDGVLHLEAPAVQTLTLGQFFDIWQQPLGPDRVGPARGTVTAFENGKVFHGNPRDIPLLDHAVVQLDVGTVVPFQPMHFKVNGLCGAGTAGCAKG